MRVPEIRTYVESAWLCRTKAKPIIYRHLPSIELPDNLTALRGHVGPDPPTSMPTQSRGHGTRAGIGNETVSGQVRPGCANRSTDPARFPAASRPAVRRRVRLPATPDTTPGTP